MSSSCFGFTVKAVFALQGLGGFGRAQCVSTAGTLLFTCKETALQNKCLRELLS